ncbi:MAG: S8 family serine peptidase [Nibricoccus sp.]
MTLKHIFFIALLTFALIAFFAFRGSNTNRQAQAPIPDLPADLGKVSTADMDRLMNATVPTNTTSRELLASISEKLRQRIERANARPREAVLSFKNAEALRAFLARAESSGLHVLDRIDAFNTVRVQYDSTQHLARELIENSADYAQVAANFYINNPDSATPPQAQARAARNQTPVGNQLLSVLGVAGGNANWGNGVTIAILDSGVAADPTFGLGRLKTIDIGLGTAPAAGTEGGHGTAVASLAAGQSADAQGVAPAASLLSIRVADNDGKSDSFTVARAILAAVDAGAKIVNVSLGGYGTNFALDYAIDYATTRGVVLVAAAGNDQAAQLTWPAADPRVISVGAVDANGQQVIFSNSGEQLKITAPGLALQAAWSDGTRVNFSGTSGSAPVVSGSIAALMSQNPELTAPQAWQILQSHANEAGRPGADADYGSGVLNLGWSIARNDPTRVDTAVASHYYNATNEQLQIVLQNRSASAVAGMDLNIEINGALQHYPVSWLAAGSTTIVNLPISANQLAAAGQIEFRTELVNPTGTTDAEPANNRRYSALSAPGRSR